jgi:hypothetical protein
MQSMTLGEDAVASTGPHMAFPAIRRLRQVGESYVWQPVVYTDEWISR